MFFYFLLWFSSATLIIASSSHFKLELTWEKGAPDGYERDMIFINGQYPGPILDMQQGDWVEIEVVNNMPFNTSIHAHGIHQTNTPWADGVPGLTQRPIQPGSSFTYRWYADQFGSYFYHAHSRGQIDDGAYGPMIIRPKAGISKPFSMIDSAEVEVLEEAEANTMPLILSDWRHRTSEQTMRDQSAAGFATAVCIDSLLVNGKGAVDCWSREEINALASPAVRPVFGAAGLQMTDKGCPPPQFYQITFGNSTVIDPTAVPPEVFEVCTPTKGSREKITVPQGKRWMSFDIISAAGIDTFAFSIDEHPMWVYAVDGHYIEPLKVDVLTVANGDRYSVFVEVGKEGNYGIRVASVSLTQLIDTTAILSYEKDQNYTHYMNTTSSDHITSTPHILRNGRPASPNVTVFDQGQMVSFPPEYPTTAPEIAQTIFLTMGSVGNSYIWALNSTPFMHSTLDDTSPPLLYDSPSHLNPGGNVTITTQNNTWIDLVFLNPLLSQPPHPIHKHANPAFILGAGEGDWTWSTVAEAAEAVPENFNLVTPPYRDGFVTPVSRLLPTWLAVRYHVVNPGAWLLHCHVQSHLSGGMAVVILDGVDEWPVVPEQ